MPNLLAVLVSAIIAMAIGALWYSPLLFGKTWMKLMKFSEKDINEAKKKGMIKSYITSFVSTLIMVYIVGYLIDITDTINLISGAILGILFWLGFIATTMINGVLWKNKPIKLYILNISHYFIVLIIAGIILTVWR